MELLDIERALAALDVELKLCRVVYLLQKHGADQPRVPAGSPEGGQWTSGGGGGDDSTEAEGDAQIQLVQGDPLQGYPVDLREDQACGGHTLERHVGKSESFLKTEVQEMAQGMAEDGQDPRGVHLGSFTSLQSATRLVSSTPAQNRDVVDEVIGGQRGGAEVDAVFVSQALAGQGVEAGMMRL
jgi:hypothetical protein